MNLNDQQKGIIFGILGIIGIGFQPIVANSRPAIIDAYLFAATTCLVEAIVFFPLMLMERKRLLLLKTKNPEISEIFDSQINGWKKNKRLCFYIGATFGIGQILFFVGYQLSGAINGSLAQKTTVIFSLIFGYLILKEKITKIQLLFSFVLVGGLIIAVTQGSLNLLEFNLGVLILLILSCIWMLAHTLSKPLFDRKEITPTQLVFIRNFISGLILISTYFLFFPIENVSLFYNFENLFFMWAMGVVYCAGLFCWYKTLSYLDVSKASILVSPTPIATALFATLLLGETFTIYHVIGISIIIISIIVIVKQK